MGKEIVNGQSELNHQIIGLLKAFRDALQHFSNHVLALEEVVVQTGMITPKDFQETCLRIAMDAEPLSRQIAELERMVGDEDSPKSDPPPSEAQ
jgi:hypothetical protein